MIQDEIMINLLEPVFINKNFILGEESCNYEKYLLELVNHSIYFREKSNYIEYVSPSKEAHGECDCVSPNYQIDFKLLASTTRLHASKELSNQIQILCKGVTSHCGPRKPNTKMTVTKLFVALREYNFKELYSFLHGKYEYGTIEKDLQTYVKLLEIKKNLFFFFPYRFSFEKHYKFDYAIDNINIALKNDFRESNLFRETYCSGYDTYIAYIYDEHLIISKFENTELKIVDTIYLFKSATYKKLHNYLN